MRLVEEKHIKKLQDVYDFIEAFVDYYDGDPEVYEGEPTDAARMKQCLPAIKEILKSKRHVEKKAVEPQQPTFSEEEFKNAIYNAEKRAAEAVNPNYRYCVVDPDMTKCALTDDIEHAMREAKSRSMCGEDFVYVLEIRKTPDGYMTFFDAVFMRGEYTDAHDRESYLHYNYIAEATEKIYKI